MLARLGRIDLTPSALRKDLTDPGARLRDVGWALDMAAKISAETRSLMIDRD
ncbi:MAG: hypothetical protein VYE18_00810 [Pseudomonadota bacterium]|nr:hypothetical protein [Pseudomonadota bacterium]